MELVIAIALGAWISFGGWISYRSIRKEFSSDADPEARSVSDPGEERTFASVPAAEKTGGTGEGR